MRLKIKDANGETHVFTEGTSSMTPDDWVLLAYVFQWNYETLDITSTFIADGATKISYTHPPLPSIFPNTRYVTGANQIGYDNTFEEDTFLVGFIWETCYYTIAKTDFTDEIGGPCGVIECQVCPVDVCLIDCEWDQSHLNVYCEDYPDIANCLQDRTTGTCEECPDDCDPGQCVRSSDCTDCVDILCKDCDNWIN